MKKKFLWICFIMLLTNMVGQAQDKKMIGFKPIVTSKYAPENVTTYVEHKVSEIMANEGIGHTSGNFVLDVNINEISKVVTPTSPPRVQVKIEVAFKTIDKTQGVVLNTMTMSASALENSENAAYMKAAESLNIKSRNFLNFLKVSRERLYEYYEAGYAQWPTTEYVEPEPEVRREEMPTQEEETIEEKVNRIELYNGIYVEYLKYEHKSSSTDVILRFTNTNSDDANISFTGRNQLMIDSTGKNISNYDEKYLDGSSISGGNLTLIEDIPVTIRIMYRNVVTPKVVYLHERNRDVKVKIKCD